MKSYIYKSSKKDELYIYLPKKDDFTDVPQMLFDMMGKQPLFVMELELSVDKPLARENVATVIKNLESQGFHVQMPPAIHNLTGFKTLPKYVN